LACDRQLVRLRRSVSIRLAIERFRDGAEAIGAVLMSLSTIIVAINAQLLRRVRL